LLLAVGEVVNMPEVVVRVVFLKEPVLQLLQDRITPLP